MKKLIAILCVVSLIACKETKNKSQDSKKEDIAYLSFGEKITDDGSISKDLMSQKFESLKAGDTINVKFTSSINEVCQTKGCWMKLDLGNGKESMVKFKDYGFFMPLNAASNEVVVDGKAFVSEMSVEEQQHLAKDAGKTKEEIDAITAPKITYSFEANGVLMKQ
ncbi:MAG: DUF4920 domain-containing protein [Flavobacteriales bacterium]|mgnify:CR=1 FL=1|jgi:hypothetical protein|nr:DUF4920 domain-containing protein [Flavobacteriales bacterium]